MNFTWTFFYLIYTNCIPQITAFCHNLLILMSHVIQNLDDTFFCEGKNIYILKNVSTVFVYIVDKRALDPIDFSFKDHNNTQICFCFALHKRKSHRFRTTLCRLWHNFAVNYDYRIFHFSRVRETFGVNTECDAVIMICWHFSWKWKVGNSRRMRVRISQPSAEVTRCTVTLTSYHFYFKHNCQSV